MSGRVSRADRSLASFVQALEGLNVVVELQNDAVVRGLLESADEGMNLIIIAATYEPLQGATQSMDFLFVKGARVRCNHRSKCSLSCFWWLHNPGQMSS